MTKIPSFEDVANSHGHRCPGIAVGYKIAVIAAEWAGDEDDIRVFSTTTRCPLDALRFTFQLKEHPERLTVDDQHKLHFELVKPSGEKLIIDEVPGSKINSVEGDAIREKIRAGTATPDEIKRFDEIQKQLLQKTFDTPNEKLFIIRE